MNELLSDDMLESVNGGTVIISIDHSVVGFDTLGEMYTLVNVDPYVARNLAERYKAENKTMGNAEFDKFIKAEFQSRGWLAPYTK